MKRINIIIITILIAIGILFVATTKNYAVESQNNTTNTTVSTTKSSNTILTSLGIRPYDFTGFKNAVTTYDVTVPSNIQSVEVYATTKDSKATLEGVGTKTLQMGKNVAEVTVIAEDGTKKTFTINIIRGESNTETVENNTNTSNVENNTEGLKSLSIKDATLSPEFQTNTYEYNAKYIGELSSLEFDAKPTNDSYIVEITGNKDLQEGENVITILVSQSNGDNVATYQIIVNKSLVDVEAIARQQAEEENKRKTIIIGAVVAIIALILIIYIIIVKKKDRDYEEEDDDEEEYNEEEDNDEDELPKALKSKQKIEKKPNEIKEDIEENYDNMAKEEIKQKFLNNYTNYEETYEENKDDAKRKKHNKGRRFK